MIRHSIASANSLNDGFSSKAIEDSITFYTPLLLPANSVALARIQSSSCHIIRSAKVGSSTGMDKPTSATSPDPVYSGMFIVGGSIGVAEVGVGCSVVAVEAVVLERIGGVG